MNTQNCLIPKYKTNCSLHDEPSDTNLLIWQKKNECDYVQFPLTDLTQKIIELQNYLMVNTTNIAACIINQAKQIWSFWKKELM